VTPDTTAGSEARSPALDDARPGASDDDAGMTNPDGTGPLTTEQPAGVGEGVDLTTTREHRGIVRALIIVAAVIMLVASLSTWLKRQALDTDNWVGASDELLVDDEIREALSRFLVDELYQSTDLPTRLEERLPANLQGLAAPLAAALQQPATDVVDRLLATEEAQAIWEGVNRRAHSALVRLLRDEGGGAVSATGGAVTLDLVDLVRQLASRLGLPGDVIDRIPEDAGQVTVIRSDRLTEAQDAVTVVEWASMLLLVLVVAMFVAAVVLARGWRRVAIRDVGIAIVVVGLALLVIQRLVGNYIVDNFVEVQANRDVAAAVWVIATGLLRDIGRNGVALGALVVLAAALAGPSRAALAVRGFISPLFVRRPGLLWGSSAVVFLLLVLWSPVPALATWWGVLVAAVLLAAAVEGLRRACEHDAVVELDEHAAPPRALADQPS
jgi:hypothetical protein